MLARAFHFNSILISTCRRLGIFNGQQHAHYGVDDGPFALWLFQEQLHRYVSHRFFQPQLVVVT